MHHCPQQIYIYFFHNMTNDYVTIEAKNGTTESADFISQSSKLLTTSYITRWYQGHAYIKK